jgi:hypothetical protein
MDYGRAKISKGILLRFVGAPLPAILAASCKEYRRMLDNAGRVR